ncbi:MAG: adenine deaminase [Saprospiraceae bacterium]
MVLHGKIVDIKNKNIFNGELHIKNGKIDKIVASDQEYSLYILPGFIDAHIHIESSMVVPYEFARRALCHGTVATVSDPHEIANVCGMEGIEFMLDNAQGAGLSFFFGAPSCVPATSFETAGATIDSKDIEILMARNDIWYLSEMMNYPGVLFEDSEVLRKIQIAQKNKKPVDGHAPGLTGEQAIKYIKHGISTDHECVSLDEALWKLKHGMKILIREGSAAKNYQALESLISTHTDHVMFCSDDKHPDELIKGHINEIVKRSIKKHDLFDVLKIACVNPVEHYKLPMGLLNEDDDADFIVVDNLKDLNIISTYCKGVQYVENKICNLPSKTHNTINQFNITPIQKSDLPTLILNYDTQIIQAIDGSLITHKTNIDRCKEAEILKIYVVNRYKQAKIHSGFISGFGPLEGAIASSVAHDSHNIVAIGKNEDDVLNAINLIIENQGGLSFAFSSDTSCLPLPVAGLMHIDSVEIVGLAYEKLDKKVKEAGSTLSAPYMTLSFMALLVIPEIKMSDLGLFDAGKFEFIP